MPADEDLGQATQDAIARLLRIDAVARPDADAGAGLTVEAPVAFARALRRTGLDVTVDAAATFAESLALVGPLDRAAVYWSGRATLVRRPQDVAAYDLAFAAFWERIRFEAGPEVPPDPIVLALDDDSGDGGQDEDGERPADEPIAVRFSRIETLRRKDFAACTDDELAELHRAVDRLRVSGPWRRARRSRPSRADTGRPDVRATLRAALRHGGDPVDRRWRQTSKRPRRVILLLDVSGSMEPYARMLVRFAHAAVAGRRSVEAFALGTRLTRLTRAVGGHDPDVAVAGAAAEVADWSGGTRLGDTLRAFNDRWGARGLARGAVVVIVSDGWDRGDPEVLDEQMARLGRVAHRVVWVNPLKGAPGYEPLARGMAAALPHVDDFVEGHTLASLEALADLLTGTPPTARVGQPVSGSRSP